MSILKNKMTDILDNNYELIKDNFVHKKAFINWDNLVIGTGNVFGPFTFRLRGST